MCTYDIFIDFQQLTIITKRSILDAAAALDLPLLSGIFKIETPVICNNPLRLNFILGS